MIRPNGPFLRAQYGEAREEQKCGTVEQLVPIESNGRLGSLPGFHDRDINNFP
jgi:hypothetical protein